MSAYGRYLIAGPYGLAEQARAAALAWDPTADTMYRTASFYLVDGGDPAVATHTCSFGLIDTAFAPAIEAAIGAQFPGWLIIQNDDPEAALAQAGLARVLTPPLR